jgi:hypothetical protein
MKLLMCVHLQNGLLFSAHITLNYNRFIMLSAIEYVLPDTEKKSQQAFEALAGLLNMDPNSQVLALSAGGNPGTFFARTTHRTTAGIRIWGAVSVGPVYFPSSFFTDRPRSSNGLLFEEAARRLTGSIERVDHTGLIVPSDVPESDWTRVVNGLAQNACLYDYPAGTDGYDPEAMRWLFVVPASDCEYDGGITIRQRRQPKIEMVWDAEVSIPVVQIDMETRLSRDQILELFPNDESFDIPGLGSFFRSVNVTTPWPGMRNMRLDLRYAGTEEVTDWNSADFFVKKGTRVEVDGNASHLPRKKIRRKEVLGLG